MNQYELYHHGVKGMKWGHCKNRYESGVQKLNRYSDKAANAKLGYNRRRNEAKAHNQQIKNSYLKAKQQVKEGNLSKSSSQYISAKSRRTKNLVGRAGATMVGYGKSDQGRYYKHVNNGKTKTEAALRTYGHKVVAGIAVSVAVNFGKKAVEAYLENR